MECPSCHHAKTEVNNSRRTKQNTQIWRRRSCPQCQQIFTTYEYIDLSFCTVLKRDDTSETYNPDKLFLSIQKACERLQGDIKVTATALTKTVEIQLIKEIAQDKSITSAAITNLVAKTLKNYNLNAFVRYVSHHKNIDSARQLNKLLEEYSG